MTETFDQFENALRSTVAVLADRKDSLIVFKGQFDSPFQGVEMDRDFPRDVIAAGIFGL